jgi:serine/threonine-protein kinase RsbW
LTEASRHDATPTATAGSSARLAVPARADSLPGLLAFIDAVCRGHGLAPDVAFDARLAVDEMCTNIVVHGYRGLPPGPVALEVAVLADRIVIRIFDRGRAFDPRNAQVPDVHAPLEERDVGGLGCHLVRSVMDDIDYASTADGGNCLTLTKLTPRPA